MIPGINHQTVFESIQSLLIDKVIVFHFLYTVDMAIDSFVLTFNNYKRAGQKNYLSLKLSNAIRFESGRVQCVAYYI